jgi:Protein of unknown function (DUF3108)
MTLSARTAALALAGLLALGALPLAGQPQPLDEEFRYRWQLRNIGGFVAGLFLPRQGEGALTFETQANGDLRSELLITSKEGGKGEYWRYGALIDPARLQPLRAWSSYNWRGESKSKNGEITTIGVMDVVSGIYAIRRDPPVRTRRMEIWSDGRIYPVDVVPLGLEQRTLPGGRRVTARHFSIRAAEATGDRKRWKGKLDLWFTPDAAATPVEIQISRNLADVRLQLLPGQI